MKKMPHRAALNRWQALVASLLLSATCYADEVTLAQALEEAAAQAPELFAARARTRTARAEIISAGALPNTTLALGAGGADPLWTAGVIQRFHPWGVRSSRVEAAEKSAEAAHLEEVQTTAAIRATARRAFYALVRGEDLLALSARTVELARTAESAAKTRFETGAAPRLDVVQAALARGALETARSGREAERDAAAAELALLLGRDPIRPLTPKAAGAAPNLPQLSHVLSTAASGPLAQARNADVNAAEARLGAARATRLPAPALGAAVESNHAQAPSTGNELTLRGTLELDLPLLGLNRGEIAVASSQLDEAKVLRDIQARARTAAIVAAHSRLTAALRAAARYREEILPAAAEAEQMALDAYRGGKTSLTALLDAQRAAAETRVQAVQSNFDAEDAFSQLEIAAGVPLDTP